MRRTLFVAAAFFALAAPALADNASDLAAAKAEIAAAKLSPESDLNMWCGAALTLQSSLEAQTKPDEAKAASAAADMLFGQAAALLATDGVAEDKMAALSTDYTAVAFAQLQGGSEKPAYTQDQCKAAANDQ